MNRRQCLRRSTATTVCLLGFLAPFTSAVAQLQTAIPAQAKLNVNRDIPYAEPADPRQNVDIYVPEKDPGIPARRCAAKETNHSKLNENVGLPDDPPTKALFEFVDEALRK